MKPLLYVGLLFVTLSPSALAAPALKDPSKHSPIVGEWSVERVTQDAPGSRTDAEYVTGERRYGFSVDGRWTGIGSATGRYKIDSKAAPGSIELTYPAESTAEEAGVHYSGSFQIDGDSLILRLSAPGEVKVTIRLRRATGK